mgnify:CR=1 FL=1
MNDEGVCRTAPATLGLLKTDKIEHSFMKQLFRNKPAAQAAGADPS